MQQLNTRTVSPQFLTRASEVAIWNSAVLRLWSPARSHSAGVGELIRKVTGGTGKGGVWCSILARRDETLLRLDHSNIGRAIERRRKWFARAPRPPDGAEPILQTRRRDEPE